MLELSHLVTPDPKIIYIGGCMFSGKTEVLRLLFKRYGVLPSIKSQIFYPILDNRYREDGYEGLESHDRDRIDATPVKSLEESIGKIESSTNVIGFDEIQFFSSDIINFALDWRDKNNRILIAAGLTRDYRDRPFEFIDHKKTIGNFMEIADYVITLNALCTECGKPATVTERIITSDKLIIVGGKEAYTAKCRTHYKEPS